MCVASLLIPVNCPCVCRVSPYPSELSPFSLCRQTQQWQFYNRQQPMTFPSPHSSRQTPGWNRSTVRQEGGETGRQRDRDLQCAGRTETGRQADRETGTFSVLAERRHRDTVDRETGTFSVLVERRQADRETGTFSVLAERRQGDRQTERQGPSVCWQNGDTGTQLTERQGPSVCWQNGDTGRQTERQGPSVCWQNGDTGTQLTERQGPSVCWQNGDTGRQTERQGPSVCWQN